MLAGMHKNVLETVSQKYKNYSEFMNAYSYASESLNNACPDVRRIEPRQDIRDIFYNQVIFCLGGETKYVSEELCSGLSL